MRSRKIRIYREYVLNIVSVYDQNVAFTMWELSFVNKINCSLAQIQ